MLTAHHRVPFIAALAAFAALTACSAARVSPAGAPALDGPGQARLQALRTQPEQAGTVIYEGLVHDPQAAAGSAPPYRYERRVSAEPAAGARTTAHLTQGADGELVVAETATFDAGYRLQRFEALNRQQGYRGSVDVSADGRELHHRLWQDGRETEARERVEHPVVAGPSLHGWIAAHWTELLAGRTLPVRLIVMAKKTTYGFDIRHRPTAASSPGEAGPVVFTVTPSKWLVRLAVAPLVVSFDAQTRQVVRYEGRVPPLRVSAGRTSDFDARVDYTMRAAVYR